MLPPFHVYKYRFGWIPKRSAMLLGGLLEPPNLVANRCDVSAYDLKTATVSIDCKIAEQPVSLIASCADCAIKS